MRPIRITTGIRDYSYYLINDNKEVITVNTVKEAKAYIKIALECNLISEQIADRLLLLKRDIDAVL